MKSEKRMRNVARAFLLCSVLLFGCTLLPTLDAIELPASFQGTMPCADCEGIETTLSLRDDGLYFLRQRYVGATLPRSSVELGPWHFTEGKRGVALDGKTRTSFAVLTPTQLQTIDQAHQLDRLADWNPIGGPIDVRGEYSYVEDIGRITECSTGHVFPVALAGDNRALEHAYLAARVVTGSPMLVTFEGRLARVTPLGSTHDQDAFVVDRFERLWPSASCATTLALPIVGTRWRLTELEGSGVYLEDGSPELTFGENNRVSGSTGCNKLSGPYNFRDTALSFGRMASTRRACADTEKRELETRFDTMLERVDGVRVERVHLELLDGVQPVARFVAQE